MEQKWKKIFLTKPRDVIIEDIYNKEIETHGQRINMPNKEYHHPPSTIVQWVDIRNLMSPLRDGKKRMRERMRNS